MSKILTTEMTFKIRLVDEISDEKLSNENIEIAEKRVGYKLYNDNGTLTDIVMEGQSDDVFGVVKTLLDMEDIDIIDCTYDKCELIKQF